MFSVPIEGLDLAPLQVFSNSLSRWDEGVKFSPAYLESLLPGICLGVSYLVMPGASHNPPDVDLHFPPVLAERIGAEPRLIKSLPCPCLESSWPCEHPTRVYVFLSLRCQRGVRACLQACTGVGLRIAVCG